MNPRLIGKNIRLARQTVDMSQKELAQKLGVSWEMISRYENGRSNALNRLMEISNILSHNIDFFLSSHELDSKLDNNKVPFLFEVSIDFEATLRDFEVTYNLPEWVVKNYSKLFVLKLKNVKSEVINIDEKDLGVFSTDLTYDYNYYLSQNKLIKASKDSKLDAGLIYIEKRFV